MASLVAGFSLSEGHLTRQLQRDLAATEALLPREYGEWDRRVRCATAGRSRCATAGRVRCATAEGVRRVGPAGQVRYC